VNSSAVIDRAARRGVWALPVYSILLAAGTVTHQPDPKTDFAGYARFVTTGHFLLSHLVASILGAAIGIIGVVALCLLVIRGRSPLAAVFGAVASIIGNVLVVSVFGAAAYAQPAIGRAYDRDPAEAMKLNDDVYGPALFATVGIGLLLFTVGAVLVGRAVARSHRRLRAAGIAYAILLPLFAITGFLFDLAQPVMALGLAIATTVIALRVRNLDTATPATVPAADAASN
jgi:hypothetical protein